jgi:arylsulfatase A-like enzyme
MTVGFPLPCESKVWQLSPLTLLQVFETATRVPFILSAPWMAGSAGKVSDEPVELVDLYRTLADLAGLPQPPAPSPMDHTSVQGKSLVPVLELLGGGLRKCDHHRAIFGVGCGAD